MKTKKTATARSQSSALSGGIVRWASFSLLMLLQLSLLLLLLLSMVGLRYVDGQTTTPLITTHPGKNNSNNSNNSNKNNNGDGGKQQTTNIRTGTGTSYKVKTQSPTLFPTSFPTVMKTQVPTVVSSEPTTMRPYGQGASVSLGTWTGSSSSSSGSSGGGGGQITFNQQGNNVEEGTETTTSDRPSQNPTIVVSDEPSSSPSSQEPSSEPSWSPSDGPTDAPSNQQTTSSPSSNPTITKSDVPSGLPSQTPSIEPTSSPTSSPTVTESTSPSDRPSLVPSSGPTISPTSSPTISQSVSPSDLPSLVPSTGPTPSPTVTESMEPSTVLSITAHPSSIPSDQPSLSPSITPTTVPTDVPSDRPSLVLITSSPSISQSTTPTEKPTRVTLDPTIVSTTSVASDWPSASPSRAEPTSLQSITTNNAGLSSSPPTYLCDVCPDVGDEVRCLQDPDDTINLALLPNNATKACGVWEAQGLSPLGIVPIRCNNFLFAVQNGACGGCGTVCPSKISVPPSTSPSSSPSPSPSPKQDDAKDMTTTDIAEASIVLFSVTGPMDDETVEQFESTTLQFFNDQTSSVIDDDFDIEFNYVVVVYQVPIDANSPLEGRGNHRHLEDEEIMDLNVFFEVGGEMHSSTTTDFQWIVDTVLETNIDSLLSMLATDNEYFEASEIQGRGFEQEKILLPNEQKDTSDSFFNTWIIASIGVVVLSIFVSSMFITRATRHRRQRRRNVLTDQDFDDAFNQHNFSPVAEDSYGSELNTSELQGNSKLNEFRRMYGWNPGGLEVVEEESEASQSLAGLDYVGSAAGSIAAISRSSGDGISTLTGPTVKDKKALEAEQPGGGLNARMRKRLIEREVQKNGVQAGISMEAILLGTASFSDESNDGNTEDYLKMKPKSDRSVDDETVPQKNKHTMDESKRKSEGHRSRGLFGLAGRGIEDGVRQKELPKEKENYTVAGVNKQPQKKKKDAKLPRKHKMRKKQMERGKRKGKTKDQSNDFNEEFHGIGARPLYQAPGQPKPLQLPESPDSGYGYVDVSSKSMEISTLTTSGVSEQGKILSPWRHPGRIRTDFIPTPIAEDYSSAPPSFHVSPSDWPPRDFDREDDALPHRSPLGSATYQQEYHYSNPSRYDAVEQSDSNLTDMSTASSAARPSGVRLVKRGTKLSKIERIDEDKEKIFEMTVGAGDSSVIVGSMKNGFDGGLELELGHAV